MHIDGVHKGIKHTCDLCGFRFKTKCNLYRHLKAGTNYCRLNRVTHINLDSDELFEVTAEENKEFAADIVREVCVDSSLAGNSVENSEGNHLEKNSEVSASILEEDDISINADLKILQEEVETYSSEVCVVNVDGSCFHREVAALFDDTSGDHYSLIYDDNFSNTDDSFDSNKESEENSEEQISDECPEINLENTENCLENQIIHGISSNSLKENKSSRLSCHLCSKTFAGMTGLIAHRKSVHENFRYECKICKKEFRYFSGYNKHKKVKPAHCVSSL